MYFVCASIARLRGCRFREGLLFGTDLLRGLRSRRNGGGESLRLCRGFKASGRSGFIVRRRTTVRASPECPLMRWGRMNGAPVYGWVRTVGFRSNMESVNLEEAQWLSALRRIFVLFFGRTILSV